MKKIESLNNARKTVLKLEKEINAISNNLSKVKNKDHWYYVLVGDLNNLQRLIKNNKSLLYEKDALGRTLLYLAARNG